MDRLHICSIVGARPNFVKLAALSPEIRKVAHETIIHTGQHYDYSMSQAFFNELNIPEPDIHLDVGSYTHGEQTGRMLCRIERELFSCNPDAVIVYGDTNSTLAGALAAAKLHIPVIHIEAGARSFNKRMPEEVNRILIDQVSSLLFCSTLTGYHNLARENVPATKIFARGDVIVDLLQREAGEFSNSFAEPISNSFNLLTVHREENTDAKSLVRIFDGLLASDEEFIFPCHPRLKNLVPDLGEKFTILPPVGYWEMRYLESHAKRVVTDSGGVQKEAYLLGTPCITLREQTEWVETLDGGWNILTGTDPERIQAAFKSAKPSQAGYHSKAFGLPGVCRVIARIITEEIRNG